MNRAWSVFIRASRMSKWLSSSRSRASLLKKEESTFFVSQHQSYVHRRLIDGLRARTCSRPWLKFKCPQTLVSDVAGARFVVNNLDVSGT